MPNHKQMSNHPWTQPDMIEWSQLLINNLNQYINLQLDVENKNPLQQSRALFFAPFVVVSHSQEEDPILNYGNQIALDLWQMDWDKFTQTPSRLTAEAPLQAAREKMLKQVSQYGYIDDYQGVRISSTGKKFWIEQALVCNLTDKQGKLCGQAATFDHWRWL